MNSPEGKDLIAKAFAEGPLGDAVAPVIGGSAAKLIDKLKGKVREKDPEDDAEELAPLLEKRNEMLAEKAQHDLHWHAPLNLHQMCEDAWRWQQNADSR